MKLIDERKHQYKVELHSHTDCSDGAYSPEELKALYRKKGFDAVAFTDHDIFLRHNELTDDSFVALNGYELNVPTPAHRAMRCFHINFIAESPEISVMPGFDPMYVFQFNAKMHMEQVQGAEPSGFRDFTPEGMNRLIRAGNESGFLVSFNHPGWSLCTDRDYLPLEGLFAVEVHNSGNADYRCMDEAVYQSMLLQGKKLNCLATNDFHSFDGEDMSGAVYVQAEELTYTALIKALKEGRFYSSNGPKINRLEIVDDVLYIACSEAKSVVIETATEHPRHIVSADGSFTEGNFRLGMAEKEWFRVTVTDKEGKKAWTNAVFNYPLMQLQEAFPDGCDSLLLCGREERLTAEDAGAQGRTCFVTEFVADQIEELITAAETTGCKALTAVFSTTESLHFDLYYYAGTEYQKAKQLESLTALENALDALGKWLKNSGISLKIVSMRPLPHNPAIYDYRNGHIRAVNERLCKFCINNGAKFVDIYGAMAQENGILASEFEAPQERNVCYRNALQLK